MSFSLDFSWSRGEVSRCGTPTPPVARRIAGPYGRSGSKRREGERRMSEADVIDTLVGLAPDSPLALIRDLKPVTRQQAQASHRALFEPADARDVTMQERFAIATFVAGLHARNEITAF